MAVNVRTLLSFMIGTFSFLFLCQVQNSYAYPSGADPMACNSMRPSHGFTSQTSVSPYTISVSPAFYQPGQQMTVTISRDANIPPLKGILLQARRTGNDQIIGTWSVEGTTDFQTLACSGVDSAVTHTDRNDKPATFQLNWTPPDVSGVDIHVTATFVQTRSIFWVAERTSNIQHTCANNTCANGTSCFPVPNSLNYTCGCMIGFSGERCETDTCANNTCANGTSCFPVPNSLNYTCGCMIGFSGERCETEIDLCANNSCENGATCYPVPNSLNYTCGCMIGFSGERCDTALASTPTPVPTTPGDGQKLTHNIFIVATAICVFLVNFMNM